MNVVGCGPALTAGELAAERWHPLAVNVAMYEVSDMGRIRTADTSRPLTLTMSPKSQCPTIGMRDDAGRDILIRLASLVMGAWVGMGGANYRIKYADDNPQNCRALNLVLTPKTN